MVSHIQSPGPFRDGAHYSCGSSSWRSWTSLNAPPLSLGQDVVWSSNLLIPKKWLVDGAFRRTALPWTTTNSAALFAITTRKELCRRWQANDTCINSFAVQRRYSVWPFLTRRNLTLNQSVGNPNPWARTHPSSFYPCPRSPTPSHPSPNSILSTLQPVVIKRSGTWTLLASTSCFTMKRLILYTHWTKDNIPLCLICHWIGIEYQ